MKTSYRLSFFYGILGLVSGVFYREYTKLSGYYESTTLSVLHVHALALGMLFFLLLLVLNRQFGIDKMKGYTPWLILYNTGLLGVLVTMGVRGVLTVENMEFAGLNHIAGLFHALLGVSIIWFFILLKKALITESRDDVG